MPLVIFMRHGQADNNVNRILVGRHIESHLTEQGRKQVEYAAKDLKSVQIDRVVVSPVIRAVETAEIVCKEVGASYEIDERLYEIELGKLVGMNFDEVVSKYGNLFLKFYDEHDPALESFGVESFTSVKKRVKSLLEEAAEKHVDRNILCVTHLDPIKAAISTILDLNPEALYRWHIRNASMTILRQDERQYSLSGVNVMSMHRYPHE
ncbi:histidine phosphatase family protein [Nitrososphaera viennensis]|uniref:2,3-bisphosphoglycerate-dependent phosphoglycerate mutase n=2 Tax=Nitrososphaera viennensis TaxID=1034015 RepID=A0A060HNI8_9ARCH|nr:histidine phosphatase family protein [Nitrososphaera viennensis]AIC17028.1 2,3-bisphosphoglycerate-dependent phosphoglycerate mutase [Nitrososphaera viennensis EN76]UVS68925.1 histidine phosphatase family protein [Nitrososphaera viennensis]